MLRNGSAIPFQKHICSHCHRTPKSLEWMHVTDFELGLHVFLVVKRHKLYLHWEPIFIGTRSDRMYDERLCWEGKKDKMSQVKYFKNF